MKYKMLRPEDSNIFPCEELGDIQGDPTQTVKSNLILTEWKNAINFNLKVDSDQGRLGIWYSTIKIQKNILQHPQNLCQSQISYFEITIFF